MSMTQASEETSTGKVSKVPLDLATMATARRLAQLSSSHQAVIAAVLIPLTYEEAALRLGTAIGTVRSRLHRARAALEKIIAAEAPAPCFSTFEDVER